MDFQIAMPSTQGAVALNLGDGNSIVLDYSQTSFNQCGTGNPRRIDFFDAFPTGTAVCVNCLQQIPSKYADPTTVCVAKCVELITTTSGLSQSQAETFCSTNAHVATNYDKSQCFDNVCTTGGMPLVPFPDLRVNPENVTWVDVSPNSTAAGNTLTFPGPGDGTFDGGAASEEIIISGDAWVEFEAGELLKTHAIGVRTSPCDKAANCPDGDDTLADIPLAISLNVDNAVNIVENGGVIFTDADYQLTERFRIHVVDHHDGTADISFTRIPLASPCNPGGPCTETLIYTYTGTRPSYPLQVDATFREGPASLTNVTIMRIKP